MIIYRLVTTATVMKTLAIAANYVSFRLFLLLYWHITIRRLLFCLFYIALGRVIEMP